ncbi:MAG: hypothetical protein JO227_19145 [Acetobacteraceae bacterium]|nr:hypothetical protein [Acetobacteraceae bacterium]
MASDAGLASLRALDKVLAEKPEKVGHDFSEATRCLVSYREELISAWRSSRSVADRGRLLQLNAVLSAVMGGHFPLGPVPWTHVQKARDSLAELIG